MILLKYKELFIKFIFCSILLIIVMLVLGKVFYKEPTTDDIINNKGSNINYVDDKTKVDVEYPRFDNDKINKIITDSLYSYVKDFRNNDVEKSLTIRYELYEIDGFVNVQYTIDNSLDDIKYNNMLLDLYKGEIAYITSIYDEDYLKNEINSLVKDKYPSEVYEQVVNDTVNNFTYIISDSNLNVYFNNIKDKPNITISYLINNYKNDNSIKKHKYIIFTFDDGPSEYTKEILSILEKYNSSATFFMSGNKMKYYEDAVKEIYNSNSEVGSHGYSHTNLSNASEDEIDMEISVTNAIFNEITGGKLYLYRPAYNSYNSYMDNLELNIVKYDIDTKDWLVKNTKKTYNNVLRNACDGCIVIMRDTYKTSVEVTEKLIPELNKLGYEVVSVSKYNEIGK